MTFNRPRKTELTANIGREKFDLLPDDVTDPVDIARWSNFVKKYHAAHGLHAPSNFPLQLDFELNSTCQMKCRFCVHGQKIVEKRALTFEQYQRLILEGQKYGLVSIKLNYINEPLLVRDLSKYVRFARDHGVLNVYFATNGLLLTPDRSRDLILAGVTKIMISIDAATSATYQEMRQSPHYDKVVSNIFSLINVRKSLGKRFPLVRVNFLQTHQNIGQAERFKAMWTGVADMIGYQRQVALPGLEDNLLADTTIDNFKCSFPFKLLVIDSSGSILPCCTFSGRHMPLGNIKDMSLAEAWKSLKLRSLRRLHRNGNYKTHKICNHCVTGCSS